MRSPPAALHRRRPTRSSTVSNSPPPTPADCVSSAAPPRSSATSTRSRGSPSPTPARTPPRPAEPARSTTPPHPPKFPSTTGAPGSTVSSSTLGLPPTETPAPVETHLSKEPAQRTTDNEERPTDTEKPTATEKPATHLIPLLSILHYLAQREEPATTPALILPELQAVDDNQQPTTSNQQPTTSNPCLKSETWGTRIGGVIRFGALGWSGGVGGPTHRDEAAMNRARTHGWNGNFQMRLPVNLPIALDTRSTIKIRAEGRR